MAKKRKKLKLKTYRKRKVIKKPIKKIRQEKLKRRKNFFPTLFVIITLWVATAAIVYFLDPYIFGTIPILLFVLFITLLFTLATILGNARRGLIAATSIIIFLILRLLGVGNIINLLLIAGVALSIEFYFFRN